MNLNFDIAKVDLSRPFSSVVKPEPGDLFYYFFSHEDEDTPDILVYLHEDNFNPKYTGAAWFYAVAEKTTLLIKKEHVFKIQGL